MDVAAFSAPYDSTTKAISAVVCVILIGVAFLVHIIFIALLLPLMIFLGYAYSPRGYTAGGGTIVIRRLIGNIVIPISAVREIRPGGADDFTGCIRLWGSGGFFGYYGLFKTSKLGKSYWYMTDRSKSVVVATTGKTYVLSPDDVQGFIAAAGATSGAAAPMDAAPFRGGSNPLGKLIAVGIAAVALVLMAMAFIYSPGPPGYTLANGQLTIHDLFYPVTLSANAIDGADVRIVDLTADSEWRPTLRTNGFANQHYQSGWFRVAGGKTVRLYRAGGTRLVLIPPKDNGAFVLYQAKDPEAFVQELRQQTGN